MKLYWLDLETTGLDPVKNDILEVAVMEADFERPFDVRVIYDVPIWTGLTDAELDPFIVDMHTKNGLLAECREGIRCRYLHHAETSLLDLIPTVEDKDERGILAGSSVHFDHSFLRHHMPTLAGRFSHRHYDVSAIKLFCQSCGMTKFPKAEAHRALADVKESIDHASRCLKWLLETGRS
jgi:oligoribonuclease